MSALAKQSKVEIPGANTPVLIWPLVTVAGRNTPVLLLTAYLHLLHDDGKRSGVSGAMSANLVSYETYNQDRVTHLCTSGWNSGATVCVSCVFIVWIL